MSRWNQPICERCWIEKNTDLVDGELHIRQPAMVMDAMLESCSYCDELTIVGIYVRDDPKKVPFPQKEEEDGTSIVG